MVVAASSSAKQQVVGSIPTLPSMYKIGFILPSNHIWFLPTLETKSTLEEFLKISSFKGDIIIIKVP